MSTVKRPEDMSPDGFLELHKQDDGDIIVSVRSGDTTGVSSLYADVEFCNSGGHSPWTLQALYKLMEAMEKDDRGEPWPKPPRLCEDCGCELGRFLGDLECHSVHCEFFPL